MPPDLLAFPRFPQSPSIQSSISNIHDARIYGRSPLTSPVYGETTLPTSGFRTLQHPKTGRTIALATTGRSNSPFMPAPLIYPASMMKQGYVTIPRKPRAGSWAPAVVSELSSPTSPTPTLEIAEPVYDNLGLRTTAGGSILNLTKIPQSSKSATSPGANLKYSMKDRPLPATPASSVNGDHNLNNGSIREPLYSSSSNSERKIPPRPPPKPKKSGSIDLSANPQRITTNGHSYEDEGEDGTEV